MPRTFRSVSRTPEHPPAPVSEGVSLVDLVSYLFESESGDLSSGPPLAFFLASRRSPWPGPDRRSAKEAFVDAPPQEHFTPEKP